MKKIISVIPAILLFSFPLASAASANSAELSWSWEGVFATGTIITDEKCPIVVEKELLTFDVNEFPKETYNSEDDLLAYNDRVTAEYTFYNPADYAVTATLVFPFGALPNYVYFTDIDYADRYGVSVNGEELSSTLRHTLTDRQLDFDLASDIPRLRDDFTEDEFYYLEMPVYCETYMVTGVTKGQEAFLHFIWRDYGTDKRTIIVEIQEEGTYFTDENAFGRHVYNGQQIKLWYFGEYHGSPEWSFSDGEHTISGSLMNLYGKPEEMTFMDFAMQGWTEASGVS